MVSQFIRVELDPKVALEMVLQKKNLNFILLMLN